MLESARFLNLRQCNLTSRRATSGRSTGSNIFFDMHKGYISPRIYYLDFCQLTQTQIKIVHEEK